MSRPRVGQARHVGAFLVSLLIGATSVLAAAGSARGLTLAITDDVWFTQPTPQAAQRWVARAAASRAHIVLLEADWNGLEPSPPLAGTDPTNPAGREYDFSYLDARLRYFARSGIQIALLVGDAPHWAETPGGPGFYEDRGAWKPSATAFGQMARALALRYSGSYPDPLHPGRMLPRVRYFQAWGEANFSIHLAPQWIQQGGAWTPYAPSMYRDLLNAFYAGVKSVHSDNFVITTGFGPYGDPPGGCTASQGVGPGCRMHPALFARELLCLHGSALGPEPCPNPAHFDVMAADPYQVSSPTTAAFNIDDVSSPDLGKLTRVLTKAVRLGRALPRVRKRLWVTEFSYDSNPPNRTAVSLATQARWLDEALYLFWKQGVSTVVWYLLRDQAATYKPNTYYSGLFFYTGVAKPSFRAFRFPFVVWPQGSRATVWGVAPRGGRLSVQQKVHGAWKTLLSLRVSAGRVFVRTIPAKLRGSFRGVVAGESSLVWSR